MNKETKKPKPPKAPKPRVMWAIYDGGHGPIITGNQKLIRICERNTKLKAVRVAVIPLDDVEGIIERAYQAFVHTPYLTTAPAIVAALTAAGIPCKQRRARK